jgi:hypothetical protein
MLLLWKYLNLKFLDGQKSPCHSICSSPDSGELRIAVKKYLVVLFFKTKLKAGVLEVGPEENLPLNLRLNAKKLRHLQLEITPVMSYPSY